jgi:hypothetical protein
MRYVLMVLTILTLVAPVYAAEKPIPPADFDALRILDLEATVARERAEKAVLRFQAKVLALQLRDGAKDCVLDEQKRVWNCPDPEKKEGK